MVSKTNDNAFNSYVRCKTIVREEKMKKLFSITINGINKQWSFNFEGDDQFLEEWRDDGLEIDEVVAEIDFEGRY